MPNVEFSLQVRYERAVRQLRKLGQELNANQLLHAIGLRWLQWIDENLRQGGTPPWRRMSRNTIAVNPGRASAHHLSSRFTTRLRQSFVHLVTGSRVTVGTNLAYADFT